jgi:hypothetical protein
MTESTEAAENRADLENVILAWVTELLEEPSVSLDDNFLDLGGHSMLAVTLDERIRARFGVNVDMRVLFGARIRETVADLADRIRYADRQE